MNNVQQRICWQEHGLAIGITVILHVAVFAGMGMMDIQKPQAPVTTPPIQIKVIQLPKPQSAPQPVVEPLPDVSKATVKPQPVEPVAKQESVAKPQPIKPQPANTRTEQKTPTKIVDSSSARIAPTVATNTQEAHQRISSEPVWQQPAEPVESAQAAPVGESKPTPAAASKPEPAKTEAFDVKNYQPMSKAAPDYPEQALDRKLEGDCTVVYQVNAQGRVEQPKAEGDCHPLFIRPSLQAAKNFKYQPRMVDGKAVVVPNVRNTFQYRIEQR